MLKVKLLHSDSQIPKRQSKYSAGYDIYSYNDYQINPNSRKLIDTGISISILNDYYGRIAPRSGLSVKGIDIGAGVIDSDYRGEIKVLLINNTNVTFDICKFLDLFAKNI